MAIAWSQDCSYRLDNSSDVDVDADTDGDMARLQIPEKGR
jgi:hypothetical protein